MGQMDFLHVIAGLLVGLLVGLTGVGGGSLMTPLLTLLFGINPTVAVGTDLMFASITKVVATGSFGLSRRVAWPTTHPTPRQPRHAAQAGVGLAVRLASWRCAGCASRP